MQRSDDVGFTDTRNTSFHFLILFWRPRRTAAAAARWKTDCFLIELDRILHDTHAEEVDRKCQSVHLIMSGQSFQNNGDNYAPS